MKRILPFSGIGLFILSLTGCGGNNSKPQLELPAKYEGHTVELIDYIDSTVLASARLEKDSMILFPSYDKVTLTIVSVDGSTSGLYITEPGKGYFEDGNMIATGTPLNEKFMKISNALDSIEEFNSETLYMEYAEQEFNKNKDNVIGEFLGLLILQDAAPERFDSLFNEMPERVKNSAKAKRYADAAHLRAKTAPGQPYVDLEGEDSEGKPLKLSSFFNGNNYVLVDFWASWCPYCIKEMPDLKNIDSKYKDKGLTIVGIAVRDLPDDTKGAVEKHAISWPIIFNTERRPYDIYGMAGIPHHILIAPDGTIISRGENAEDIDNRLSELLP